MRAWLALAASAAMPLCAQTLRLQTEFLRINPRGEILAVDQAPNPRELISPAVVRNSWASFQVVIESARGNYFLFAGSNPENAFRINVYEEVFAKRGDEWIPDALKPVTLPAFGVLPDPASGIAGQSARVYLMDVWVPPDAPVGRTRLEVQMKAGVWTIWPMEIRILPAVAPAPRRSRAPLPGPELRAVESVMGPLVEYMGQHAEGPGASPLPEADPVPPVPRTLREVIRRNAEQDMALARTLDPATLMPQLKERVAPARGGEWYLAVRDWIYKRAAVYGQ